MPGKLVKKLKYSSICLPFLNFVETVATKVASSQKRLATALGFLLIVTSSIHLSVNCE
jgi:hypothetical protein